MKRKLDADKILDTLQRGYIRRSVSVERRGSGVLIRLGEDPVTPRGCPFAVVVIDTQHWERQVEQARSRAERAMYGAE